jgi:predicted lipoprotein with Yx(FWY)xxD motif
MTVRRFLVVPGLLALTLAACSSSAASPSTQGAATTAATPSMAESTAASPSEASSGGAGEIEAEDSDLGTILVDADGNTIYFFANDEEGASNCTEDCLANWPPVPAEGTPAAGDGVTAELGTMSRDDGTTQLTVNGFPAYYFAGDQAAGETNGQGVGDVWWVFGADGEPIEN